MGERKEHEIVTRRKNELRKAKNDLINLTKDKIKDILRDINANRSNTTNLNKMTKEVEKVQETIQQVRTIKESSIKEIHSILTILDNHFRNTKKNYKIEIPLKDLDNTKLQQIYQHQVNKEIKEDILGPVLEETLKKFNTIVKQYSKKILKTLQLDSKEEDGLTITKLSQYNKRVQIQYVIEQNKITKPEDIENFKIFGPKITAKDVQEYYQTIKNQKYNLDDRKEGQRKKNQKNFKIQAIIKKALGDERETCLEQLRNEEELKKQYHTYFPNNEVTIDQFKTYLEKEKEKKEKKALKEEKQQLTPEKITLLNQTFEKISKKDLLKNKDTYSNKLKRQGISKAQFEQRLKHKEEAIYTAVNKLSREQLNELRSNNAKLLEFSKENNLWHVDDVQEYINHLINEINQGEEIIFLNSDSNEATLLQQKTQEYLYKNLYDQIKKTLENIPLDYDELLGNNEKLEKKYQRFCKGHIPQNIFQKYLEDKRKEIDIAKELNALKEEKQTDPITRELVKQQNLNINEEDFNLREETRITNEYQIKDSCNECAENIIKQLEELWKYHLKKREFGQRPGLRRKTYTGTLDTENLKEKLSQQFLEQREKEGNPKKSKWEQIIERDIDDKKQSIGSNEIILQKSNSSRIIQFKHMQVILNMTENGMKVINISSKEPRRISIRSNPKQ